MIKQLKDDTFIHEINGMKQELRYDELTVKNGLIHLPALGNKIEVLCLNNSKDEYSLKVARIFAKIASLK